MLVFIAIHCLYIYIYIYTVVPKKTKDTPSITLVLDMVRKMGGE